MKMLRLAGNGPLGAALAALIGLGWVPSASAADDPLVKANQAFSEMMDTRKSSQGPGASVMPAFFGRRQTYYGRYTGISLAAAQGAPYSESVISFSYAPDQVIMDTILGNGKAIKVFYSKEWISSRAGSLELPENCIAVKQSKQTTLAQVILCFGENPLKGSTLKTQAAMILGEGMPVPLGIFFRQDQATPENLSALYDLIRATAGNPSIRTSEERYRDNLKGSLVPVDIAEAEQILRSKDASGKEALIEKIGSNLWTGTSQEIQDRLKLIQIGLQDPNPSVKISALEVFKLGGRVSPAVDMVLTALKESEIEPDSVQSAAVKAADVLLYESYQYNKQAKLLRDVFGSDDFAAISRKINGGGGIAPDLVAPLNEIVNHTRTPERKWTVGQQQALRQGLARIAPDGNGTFSSRAVEGARKALDEFPIP